MEHREELRKYISKVHSFPYLSKKEEIELIKKIKENGDEKAKTKLINSNLKSVIKIAKKYYFGILDLWDLIQEGNIGLIKAIDKFDPKKRKKFSFYAQYWIKAEIIRTQYKQNLIIELPINIINWISNYNKTKNQMIQKNNELPFFEETAVKTGKPIEKAKKIMAKIQETRCISENTPISGRKNRNNSDKFTVKRFLTKDSKHDPENILYTKQLKLKIRQMLCYVSARRERILRMRFGIGIEENHTLREIGEEFKITREAIRLSEKAALKELRQIFVTGTKKFPLDEYL